MNSFKIVIFLLLWAGAAYTDQCQFDYDHLTIDPKDDMIAYETYNERHRGRVQVEIVMNAGHAYIKARVSHSKTNLDRILFSERMSAANELSNFSTETARLISDLYASMAYYQYAASATIHVKTSSHKFINHEKFQSELEQSFSALTNRRRVPVILSFD